MTTQATRFTRMDQSTAEEWRHIMAECAQGDSEVPDKALGLLKQIGGHTLGFAVDRYEHSLQTATRALRGGADEEMIVVALLHDIGDFYVPGNHATISAAILQPYISAENYWLVKHHAIFQGYYYFHHIGGNRDERERFRGHPAFEKTAEFCERWDQTSFDPNYDTLPLETFEPMVRRILHPSRMRGNEGPLASQG